jgi:ABC-2 type transport system ATP-binding protein
LIKKRGLHTLSAMNHLAIKIKQLKKTYDGGFQALKGIDLTVPEGAIFGLLGPNGAGKSTIIGILCSLVNKTEGLVEICGHDIDKDWSEAKKNLGVVPQEFNFNIFEPCLQIITNQAGYYGVPYSVAKQRAEHLLKELGLWDKRHTPSGKLSGGMKRRLMIARALVHQPKILILDEPTAGVDISLRRSMWAFLEEQNRQGLTIILTTHYLEEAEQLCETIAIIDKGVIIENTNKVDLLKKMKCETFILTTDTPCTDLPQIDNASLSLNSDGDIEVIVNDALSITALLSELEKHSIIVRRLQNKSSRLEELFVRMVEA